MNSNAKIGLFGTGLDTYWGQFDGLLDELKGYQARIRDRMERDAGVQVADAGMVDSPARALEAASLFAREQVDLVFLYMATYCLSSTILPVVQRLNCPVVVLNLQPTPGHRLRAAQRPGRPRPDDGHVAGELPGLARRPKSPACWRAATGGAPS